MAKITVDAVTFGYGGAGRGEPVLQGLSFSVEEGEFVCVIGPSGGGKSTLLRLLAGLSFPQAGEIRIDGRLVTGPGPDRSVVFQRYPLFPWMTAWKNVQFGIQQAKPGLGRHAARWLAEEYLARVGMLAQADKLPCQMSGGMCQRVAIARALAMDAGILLLDEPFGALDARNREELQTLLEGLCTGQGRRKTVFFITHDIREAVFLADRILFLGGSRELLEFPVPLPRPRGALSPADAGRAGELQARLRRQFDHLRGGDAPWPAAGSAC